MGKIMGVINSFVTSGVILGPMVSGLLLQALLLLNDSGIKVRHDGGLIGGGFASDLKCIRAKGFCTTSLVDGQQKFISGRSEGRLYQQ